MTTESDRSGRAMQDAYCGETKSAEELHDLACNGDILDDCQNRSNAFVADGYIVFEA